jgi:hypothetical protein
MSAPNENLPPYPGAVLQGASHDAANAPANRRTGAVAGDKKMIRHCAYVIVAMGSLSLNGAFGQVTGVTLEENDTGRTGRETLPMPAVIKTPGSQLPPPGGNPLWGIPISALTATRERPVFSASRRSPAPPAAPARRTRAPAPRPRRNGDRRAAECRGECRGDSRPNVKKSCSPPRRRSGFRVVSAFGRFADDDDREG